MDIYSKYDSVNAKQKDQLLMGVVIAIVALLMGAMLWMMIAYGNGDIDEDMMYILSGALSGAMFFVVIIYALICFKGQSDAEKYKRFIEEEEKRKQQ